MFWTIPSILHVIGFYDAETQAFFEKLQLLVAWNRAQNKVYFFRNLFSSPPYKALDIFQCSVHFFKAIFSLQFVSQTYI